MSTLQQKNTELNDNSFNDLVGLLGSISNKGFNETNENDLKLLMEEILKTDKDLLLDKLGDNEYGIVIDMIYILYISIYNKLKEVHSKSSNDKFDYAKAKLEGILNEK